MITRNEFKVPFERNSLSEILSHLTMSGFFPQHSVRRVSSVYFDTPDLVLHRLGQEGVVPRDKVRLRWYGHQEFDMAKTTLEIKRTLAASREKYTEKFSNLSKSGNHKIDYLTYYKDQIGSKKLQPIVCVAYDRSYFANRENSRATIDTNIHYHKCLLTPDGRLITMQYAREDLNVLEMKDAGFDRALKNVFESRRIWLRFSKYSLAVESF